MKRRRLLSLMVLLVFVITATQSFALFGFGKKKNKKKGLKMGYTVMDLANPYFVSLVEGVKSEAKKQDIKITVHDAKSDAAAQVSAVENFIVQGMDAIIISPIDSVALEGVVEQAKAAGIAVINPNQEIKGRDAYISLIDHDYGLVGGKIAGEWIKNELKTDAKVAVLGFPELPQLIDRAQGLIDGIHEFAPNAEIVSQQSALTPEAGMRAAETILQSNPDVNVIVAVNDAGALGAYEAVMAAGKGDTPFCIVGLDATSEAINKIKEGGIYKGTVDIDPFGTGVLVIETAKKVIKEGPIAEMVKIGMIPVTGKNIAKY